jgi:hypothetical protein
MTLRRPNVVALSTAALIGALWGLSGCKMSKKKAVDFNESIVSVNKKLSTGGKNFGKLLGGAIRGGDRELAKIKKAHDKLLKDYLKIREETKKLEPEDEDALRLYRAHQAFLDGQGKTIKIDVVEVIAIIADKAMEQRAKSGKIMAVIKRMAKRDETDLKPLQEAQQAFALKFGFRVRGQKEKR